MDISRQGRTVRFSAFAPCIHCGPDDALVVGWNCWNMSSGKTHSFVLEVSRNGEFTISWSPDLVLNYSSVSILLFLIFLFSLPAACPDFLWYLAGLHCASSVSFGFSWTDQALQGVVSVALSGVQCICVGFNPVHTATKAMETAKEQLRDAAMHVVGRLMSSMLWHLMVLPSQTRQNPASLLQCRLKWAIASCSLLLRLLGEGGALQSFKIYSKKGARDSAGVPSHGALLLGGCSFSVED